MVGVRVFTVKFFQLCVYLETFIIKFWGGVSVLAWPVDPFRLLDPNALSFNMHIKLYIGKMKAWIWKNLVSDFFFFPYLVFGSLFILADKRRQEMVIIRGREGGETCDPKNKQKPKTNGNKTLLL